MPAKKASRAQAGAALGRYHEKRDFDRTPEPGPIVPVAGEGPLTFVVQKHRASRLHYDFRLEWDGVLKSWAVTKGPSLDPKEKRLAVMVEDHPFDYGSFEGVIPKGEYGAGEVIVWDNGTYSPDEGGCSFVDRAEAEQRMRDGLAAGKLAFTLRGTKLKGSWTLVKIARGGPNDWLLIKHRDAAVDTASDVLDEERSVFCDLRIEDLKAGLLPDRARLPAVAIAPAGLPGVKAGRGPEKLSVMLSTSSEKPFSHPDWLFEPKLDGVRAIAIIRDGEARLIGRSGLDATRIYPALAAELAQQPATEVVLDGEIVALDEDGVPSFELLQQRLNLSRDADARRADAEVPVVYYAFELLFLDGYDLRGVALELRKSLLQRVLLPTGSVAPLEHFEGEGEAAFAATREHGFEGIVAKRRASTYRSGRRSKDWLKIKSTLSDEFVVGGFSRGEGARSDTFGALLLSQYDDAGRLVYTGSAGSGFDDRMLVELRRRLDSMRVDACPFAQTPPLKGEPRWVRPELVVEVKFAQWTREGYLRAPVFLRVREDKPARDVRRAERVAAPQVASGPPASDASLADDVGSVLDQLAQKKEKLLLSVEGHKVSLSNLDKELWPGLSGKKRGLTKRDFLVYLTQVAPYMLPHLRGRPLTMTRYPNGIAGKHFYQKHWEADLPEFVETVRLFSSHNEGDQVYLLVNNLPTLLWLGQLANLEFHTWYSRTSPEPDGRHLSSTFTGSLENIEASLLNYPDFIVFDLDPYIYSGKERKGEEPELNKKAFAQTVEAARWLKEVLDSLSLSSFVKTSGRTGLHIYVPILRQLDYGAARAACETISSFVLRQHPREVTMEWTVDKRTGKVFFDVNQNVRGKTLASVYSTRPLPGAPVSLPVRWDELDEIYPTEFTILSAPERLAKAGDLWAGIIEAKHDIEGLLGG